MFAVTFYISRAFFKYIIAFFALLENFFPPLDKEYSGSINNVASLIISDNLRQNNVFRSIYITASFIK